MSRLYASIDSDARKTQATSRGHQHIESHTRGWSAGVEVVARVVLADKTDRDEFQVYMTTGSGGSGGRTLLGTVVDAGGDGPTFIPALGKREATQS